MCGIACYLGKNKQDGLEFGKNAGALLQHRGPDDMGIYNDDEVTLAQTRLSILDLSPLGHQPMASSCGRYMMVYNGEIYNHIDLRKRYLPDHRFRGHSDTETIIELFRLKQEKMLAEMVGMWAIIIWDKESKKIFISRDRYGQKPLYARHRNDTWTFSSEIKALINKQEANTYDPTALVEYLTLGNYGHLGTRTFFRDITQFEAGSYAWMSGTDTNISYKKYWELPHISEKDKVPFNDKIKRRVLHDCIVEGVLSQTLSDVPIGVTLSGGIDSSIIAGILGTYYDKGINLFTAQSLESKYDETRYVDDVIKLNSKSNFIIHRKNLNEFSIREHLEEYIKIQEEPFGDPSIMAHGFLMKMAVSAGIKVILNGQGADELFFGYNNMAQAVLSHQLRSMKINKFYANLDAMKMGKKYLMRSVLESFMPTLEHNLRTRSRIKRRDIIQSGLLEHVDNSAISLYKYNNAYNVWTESITGVHIPHLVHYDDRNGMANSIEGRMPFMDHRIAEHVAQIKTTDLLKNGMRKYVLRESCKQYMPASVYNRKDKIGFYTPLINAIYKDEKWIEAKVFHNKLFKPEHTKMLLSKLSTHTLNMSDALQIWRGMSVIIWKEMNNITT